VIQLRTAQAKNCMRVGDYLVYGALDQLSTKNYLIPVLFIMPFWVIIFCTKYCLIPGLGDGARTYIINHLKVYTCYKDMKVV
jgi:hypothetical protein